MSLSFQLATAILALAWLLLRRQAGAWSCWILLPLDLAPIIGGWLLLLSISHRPVLAAIIIFALAAGLVLVDVVKRATLREPVVFADRAELLEVIRHPQFYLPFAGPVKVIGGTGICLAAVGILAWLETTTWHPSAYLMALLAAASLVLPGRSPFVLVLTKIYIRSGFSGDPAHDIRRHGILACLIVHATVARFERATHHHAVENLPSLPTVRPMDPVVVVQIESFFDARRLGALVPATLLPGFERLQQQADATGHLEVPCWGANTVRTEFVALTGIAAKSLGLDRFNPYERFALLRIRSIAWVMKQAGYRTICLHPFDKTFYGRHRVMPQLGFDEFRGPEVFARTANKGGYVSDSAVAAEVVRIVAAEGPKIFVFAITVGNHGPWDSITSHPFAKDLPDEVYAMLEGPALSRFLSGLQDSDAMISRLMEDLPGGATLAVYGDHQPSLPKAFAALGFTDERTDYAVWSADPVRTRRLAGSCHTDQRAEDLPALLLQVLALGNMRDRTLTVSAAIS